MTPTTSEREALLRECYEWLFESKTDGPRVSEGAIAKGYYTEAFAEFHSRLQAALTREQREGVPARNPAFVGEWHAKAVELGYDGVADMLHAVERGEPPLHVAAVMAREAERGKPPQPEAPVTAANVMESQVSSNEAFARRVAAAYPHPNNAFSALLEKAASHQEAPGAVRPDFRGMRERAIANGLQLRTLDEIHAEIDGATPPAPVDVRAVAEKWEREAADLKSGFMSEYSAGSANAFASCARELRALLDGQAAGVDDEAARKAVGDVFKNLPKTGSPKHHGRFG